MTRCKGSENRVVAKSISDPLGFCLVCRQRMIVGDLRGRWVERRVLPAVPKLEGTLPTHDMREDEA